MKYVCILGIALVLMILGCHRGGHDVDSSSQTKIVGDIRNADISESGMLKAVSNVGVFAEDSPKFWSSIANNSGYKGFHRRIAFIQLLKRHFKKGMNMAGLIDMLNKPDWIKAEDVDVINKVVGLVPLELSINHTVFVIRVLPTKDDSKVAVYFKTAGRVSKEELVGVLIEGKTSKSSGAIIEDIAFVE